MRRIMRQIVVETWTIAWEDGPEGTHQAGDQPPLAVQIVRPSVSCSPTAGAPLSLPADAPASDLPDAAID